MGCSRTGWGCPLTGEDDTGDGGGEETTAVVEMSRKRSPSMAPVSKSAALPPSSKARAGMAAARLAKCEVVRRRAEG